MCVCVWACVWVCMCTCECVSVCVCVCGHVCEYACARVNVLVCVCACVCPCVCVCVWACVWVCMCTCECVSVCVCVCRWEMAGRERGSPRRQTRANSSPASLMVRMMFFSSLKSSRLCSTFRPCRLCEEYAWEHRKNHWTTSLVHCTCMGAQEEPLDH